MHLVRGLSHPSLWWLQHPDIPESGTAPPPAPATRRTTTSTTIPRPQTHPVQVVWRSIIRSSKSCSCLVHHTQTTGNAKTLWLCKRNLHCTCNCNNRLLCFSFFLLHYYSEEYIINPPFPWTELMDFVSCASFKARKRRWHLRLRLEPTVDGALNELESWRAVDGTGYQYSYVWKLKRDVMMMLGGCALRLAMDAHKLLFSVTVQAAKVHELRSEEDLVTFWSWTCLIHV